MQFGAIFYQFGFSSQLSSAFTLLDELTLSGFDSGLAAKQRDTI